MGLIHVTVSLKASQTATEKYEADFLVDTGAIDCLAPASELEKAGITRAGKMTYELASGEKVVYHFGLAVIEYMGELTSGRVIFGPDGSEPLLGVTALESVGISIDPTNRTLKRLPAIPLKKLATDSAPDAIPGGKK
jgi:clan AA aspartic protease